MNKLLSCLLASATLLAAVVPTANAVDVTGTFNTNITLNSKCEINNTNTGVATINDIGLTYTSFQTAASTGSTTFGVRCTNNLPLAVTLSQTAITDDAVNLAYTLALAGAPTVGTGASTTVTVNASIAAGQGGTCATASCTNAAATNKLTTVTVTY